MKAGPVDCDVLIVGGGAAGIGAADGAQDADRTVLLERQAFLGGLATTAMVGTVCGLYYNDGSTPPAYAMDGMLPRFGDRLAERSNSRPYVRDDGLAFLPYDVWAFQRVADEMVEALSNVQPVFHATVCEVGIDENRVVRVDALVLNRRVSFRPIQIIDCTGDATVLGVAGARRTFGGGTQAASVVFVMDGVDAKSSPNLGMAVLREVERGIAEGVLDAPCRNVCLVPPCNDSGRQYIKIVIPERVEDRYDNPAILEQAGRRLVDQLSVFLVDRCVPFANARLTRTAVHVGVRAGYRGAGRATLTKDDVLNGRAFPDGVARGTWPIEIWGQDHKPKLERLPKGSYEIPAGCLMSRDFENVLLAGRCASADDEAMASTRVIGTSMAMGWAAGVIAAGRAGNRSDSESVDIVRRRQLGAVEQPHG